mgnify:CR=1 FL=1
MTTAHGISPGRIDSLLKTVSELDLTEPDDARSHLEAVYPLRGSLVQDLRESLERATTAGDICDRGEPPVRYSRLWKGTEETHGVSADCVLMTGPGPRHRHPNGEVNLCFRVDGEPTFDGHPEGWVVLPPDSTHVPTVAGGEMFILYLLPGGAIEFL